MIELLETTLGIFIDAITARLVAAVIWTCGVSIFSGAMYVYVIHGIDLDIATRSASNVISLLYPIFVAITTSHMLVKLKRSIL